MKRKDLEEYFDEHERKAAERASEAARFMNNISEFKVNVKKEFYTVCRRVVEEKFEKYENVARSFGQFFHSEALKATFN